MGKATGWGDFQKNWHLGHPSLGALSQIAMPTLHNDLTFCDHRLTDR